MKSRKVLVLALAMMVWLAGLGMASDGYAEDFNVGGRFGIGAQLNLLNFGVGPSVEYWLTDNIGISASYGALSDFTSYGIRGNYLFDGNLDLFGLPARPYIGAGFSSVTLEGVFSTSKGTGIEIYGGVLEQASENIYLRSELIYSTVDFTSNDYIDYGAFSLGFGIVYYF